VVSSRRRLLSSKLEIVFKVNQIPGGAIAAEKSKSALSDTIAGGSFVQKMSTFYPELKSNLQSVTVQQLSYSIAPPSPSNNNIVPPTTSQPSFTPTIIGLVVGVGGSFAIFSIFVVVKRSRLNKGKVNPMSNASILAVPQGFTSITPNLHKNTYEELDSYPLWMKEGLLSFKNSDVDNNRHAEPSASNEETQGTSVSSAIPESLDVVIVASDSVTPQMLEPVASVSGSISTVGDASPVLDPIPVLVQQEQKTPFQASLPEADINDYENDGEFEDEEVDESDVDADTDDDNSDNDKMSLLPNRLNFVDRNKLFYLPPIIHQGEGGSVAIQQRSLASRKSGFIPDHP